MAQEITSESQQVEARPAVQPYTLATAAPASRRLRVYAFDPNLSLSMENAVVNEVTVEAPWESDPVTGTSTLQPGPIGEYLEVVDYDPASDCFYMPVDLDDPRILAQDGLKPAEGDPRFHQQMVYAVAMTTIKHFERALGRVAFWAPRDAYLARQDEAEGRSRRARPDDYVPRLRIYPHALREANAYYSPAKVALLFGYYPASAAETGRYLPGGTVFTCLSHDVIAHETTHALLDGLHPRWDEATNVDVLAFHEGFADIVALFQHFAFADVLRHQIELTSGDLSAENLLAKLAIEFGQTTSQTGGALRDAIGSVDETGVWQKAKADPNLLSQTQEAHERGSILVAAVFDAFLSIYSSRSQDLLRIATHGSGVLEAGRPHPDLVNRLADEAAKAARHVLTMCIRALDYCPPIDITFGEYLRALITADYEVFPDDDRGYRVAFVEAFRRRGIYPRDVRSLSISNLLWNSPDSADSKIFESIGKLFKSITVELSTPMPRDDLYKKSRSWRARLHRSLPKDVPGLGDKLGLELGTERPVEVHSVRLARRANTDGSLRSDLVIEITQRKKGYFDPAMEAEASVGADIPHDFWFRGGCTLIVDPETGRVRYCVRKSLNSLSRMARQREFQTTGMNSLRALYFGSTLLKPPDEPFALLHRPGLEEEL